MGLKKSALGVNDEEKIEGEAKKLIDRNAQERDEENKERREALEKREVLALYLKATQPRGGGGEGEYREKCGCYQRSI